MKPFQSDRFSCSISAHAEVGPCLEYATFSIRRFNIIVICPRCLIQSYSSLGVAAPKHFRAWKATANRTDFAAQSVILISVTHLLCLMFITTTGKARFAQKLPCLDAKSVTQTSMRLAPGVSSSNSWRPCSPRAVHTQSSKVLCHPHAVLRLHEVSSWSK